MPKCLHANTQTCVNAGMQTCLQINCSLTKALPLKYKGLNICGLTNMQTCLLASMQTSKHVYLQTCKQASM